MKRLIIISITIILFLIGIILSYKNFIAYPDDNLGSTSAYIEKAEESIKQNGLTSKTKFDLAGAYLIAGQYNRAIQMFEELALTDSRAYWGMALAYNKLENYDKVLNNINLLLNNPPKNKLSIKDKNEQYVIVYMLKIKAHLELHQYKQWLGTCFKVLQYQYAKS